MSHPHTLACPSCGAPLVGGGQMLAQCSYCGNYVSAHEELPMPRTSPPAAPPSASPSVIAHDELDPVDIARIRQLLHDGRKTEAIRYYRERLTPTPGLKAARDAVEAMERQMGLAPARTSIVSGLATFSVLAVACLCLCLCLALLSPSQDSTTYSGATRPTPTRMAVQPTPTILQPASIAVFGGKGTGPGQFDFARHIAIDGSGNVFVSDRGTLRVQRFDENGKYLSEWNIEAKGKFKTSTGADSLAADRAGNVYIAWTGLILKYEGATGKLLDTFAGETIDDSTRLTEDFKSVAVGPDRGLWAVSDMRSRDDLVLLDAHGKVIERIKNAVGSVEEKSFASANCDLITFLSPRKPCPPPPVSPENLIIATDAAGSLYVVHRSVYYPSVFKFTLEGKYLDRFGSDGSQPGQFSMVSPPAIAADNRNRVYVADDHRVQIFDEDGGYLDVIETEGYISALGIAVNSKNEIYMVSGKNLVFKFPPFPN